METLVLPVHPGGVDANSPAIVRAAQIIRAGGLVAFPTETVYGLGANALDAKAVGRIFEAKGRPTRNPLIVHLAAANQAKNVVDHWAAEAAQLAERFWPGPLTLVVPRGPQVPDVVTAGGPTVAVRVPAHHVARALLQAAGVPLAAPSANRSSHLSPTLAQHVFEDLNGRIELILDGGPTPGGLESTVVDLTTRPPRLLRPGPIEPAALEVILGPLDRLIPAVTTPSPLPAPGMLARHYAPRTAMECHEDDSRGRAMELVQAGFRVGWVTLSSLKEDLVVPGLIPVPLPLNPTEYAAAIYAVLHRLDRLGLDRIVVDLPPPSDAWLAIRDRLQRASTPPISYDGEKCNES
jgi:L-threonylcarbamoyladenylate synthase